MKNSKNLSKKSKQSSEASNDSVVASELSPKKKVSSRATLDKSSSASTMADLLAEVGEDRAFRGFKKGSVLKGRVSSIAGKEVLIDFGGKMEGVVGEKEWEDVKDYVSKLKVGDEISALVISPENVSAQMIVSIRSAGNRFRWDLARKLLENGEPVNVRGIEINKGGLVADFEGIRGFVPTSQLTAEHQGEINRMVNRTFQVRVIEVDQKQNRLVFSEKAVAGGEELIKKIADIKSKVKIGEKYIGKVSAIMPYGIFVNLDNGADGLVHISEISWQKVDTIDKFFKADDEVEVKVLGINENDGKLNLSIKQLLPDPWHDLAKKYTPEQQVKGLVTRVSAYGVFVKLPDGIEGLIHISKVPAGTEYKPDQEVTCTIESVDVSTHRISLVPVTTYKPIGYK